MDCTVVLGRASDLDLAVAIGGQVQHCAVMSMPFTLIQHVLGLVWP
jgi:hypothetical protein